ncbi:hypothetical protein BKA24_001759 [Microbacterium marinum]|uniref:Uncharacterized protein n=1 Tax=Microbacterium marinum TaxID=421115 RepID=A0A7W7BQR1_9MICO|nr:hypothetical protein [Microbacterium marinum]
MIARALARLAARRRARAWHRARFYAVKHGRTRSTHATHPPHPDWADRFGATV